MYKYLNENTRHDIIYALYNNYSNENITILFATKQFAIWIFSYNII